MYHTTQHHTTPYHTIPYHTTWYRQKAAYTVTTPYHHHTTPHHTTSKRACQYVPGLARSRRANPKRAAPCQIKTCHAVLTSNVPNQTCPCRIEITVRAVPRRSHSDIYISYMYSFFIVCLSLHLSTNNANPNGYPVCQLAKRLFSFVSPILCEHALFAIHKSDDVFWQRITGHGLSTHGAHEEVSNPNRICLFTRLILMKPAHVQTNVRGPLGIYGRHYHFVHRNTHCHVKVPFQSILDFTIR